MYGVDGKLHTRRCSHLERLVSLKLRRSNNSINEMQCTTYHYWHSMECANFFTQVAVCFLGIFFRIKGHIPTVVMSKFTTDELWTRLTGEEILNLL